MVVVFVGDICKKGEFTCNGSNPLVDCIPEEKVCDHRNDCGDNSDEENCDYQPSKLHHYISPIIHPRGIAFYEREAFF